MSKKICVISITLLFLFSAESSFKAAEYKTFNVLNKTISLEHNQNNELSIYFNEKPKDNKPILYIAIALMLIGLILAGLTVIMLMIVPPISEIFLILAAAVLTMLFVIAISFFLAGLIYLLFYFAKTIIDKIIAKKKMNKNNSNPTQND